MNWEIFGGVMLVSIGSLIVLSILVWIAESLTNEYNMWVGMAAVFLVISLMAAIGFGLETP